MDSRKPTLRTTVADPRSSVWNLSLDHKCERASVPKSILRNPSSHSSSKKNVQFGDRDCYSFFDQSMWPSDDSDHPVSSRRSAYPPRQGKPEDRFLSSEHVVPAAKKIDEPQRSRLLRFSSLVYGDSRSLRARYTNPRREIDSEWYPNHRDNFPASFSRALPSERPPCSPDPKSFHLLFYRPISRNELRWDLVNPLSMSRINNRLNCFSFLDGPALGSNVSSAQIHFRESRLWPLERLWGPIVVRAKGSDQPITLRHLLIGIFNYFQSPIEDANYDLAVAAIRREDIVDSWRQRNYNTYQPGYRRSPYLHDPFIRRVDFLLGFSLFRKLRLDSISSRSCDLILSIR